MRALLAALVGILHVHHAPSHDSDASFDEVVAAAHTVGLDFVVLSEHAEGAAGAALPATERAGVHRGPDGRPLLVLVGAEFGTRDGHLLGYGLDAQVASGEERPGAAVARDIQAAGGFAVVPHPLTHGGWRDWDAPLDGLEVQNSASDFRRLYGPLLPLRVLRLAVDREGALARLWRRPDAELERWDDLLAQGRRVVGFAGADAHRNVSVLGWQLDPYTQMFQGAQMLCPDGPLEPAAVWNALRRGACFIRYAHFEPRRAQAREVQLPSGRRELQLDRGRHVLELHQPPQVALPLGGGPQL